MQAVIQCETEPGENNCDKLTAVIEQNIPKIAEALIGELDWYSQNAQLVPESIKIILIAAVAPGRFKMHYRFEWNLFSPCQDLNEIVVREESVTFLILPGEIRFEVIDNARPSPADEL